MTDTLTLNQVEAILENLGWRIRTAGERRQAIRNFQLAWNLGPSLKADGVPGPLTSAALRISESRRRAGKPTASAHFSFIEFRCKCGGRYSSCARIWIQRSTIRQMERYRAESGLGISIVSGCRCEEHNRAVKGALHSQHKLGKASDFAPARSVAWFTDRGIFKPGGLGANPARLVRHGDTGPNRGWSYST